MLIRRHGQRIAVSQPTHAWISGELARAWGNADFAMPAPRHAVICGTALHDIGWLDWEVAPPLDPDTGLPRTFTRVPAQVHAPMWRRGVEIAQAYGPIPAMIVARQGESIYGRFFDPAKAPLDAAAAVRGFLDWSRAFCESTVRRLAGDPATAAFVTPDNLAFMKDFVAALDALSLHLCGGLAGAATLAVPRRPGETTILTLTPADDGAAFVDPWPFAASELMLTIEGRLLERTCRDQAELDSMLAAAPIVAVATRLRATASAQLS